jgi:pimeloyl-ACP methyl ester carboxylesterase
VPLVRANGLDIHYLAEGAGPPMVMLHGATSSAAEDWSAQRPLFRQAFRLYLVDARGHSGTRWDASLGIDSDALVDDLLGFVDAMNLATFHAVGFSLGAMTALRFGVRYPERLRTLVLVGTDVQREPRTSVARVLMDPERIEREEPAWAAQLERRHAPVQGSGAWRTLLPAIAGDVGRQPLPSPTDLRRVRVPTMVIVGDRDVFVPVDHAVALFRQLPRARLLVVPGAGHQAMVERPAIFNEAASAFYRSTAEEAAARAAAGPEALAREELRLPARPVRPPHHAVLELPEDLPPEQEEER